MATDFTVLLENGETELIAFGITFVVSFIVLFIFKKFIIGKLKASKDEELDRITIVSRGLDGFLSKTMILVFSIWIASTNLILPPSVIYAFQLILFGFIAWYVLQFLFTIIDISIDYTKSKTKEDHIMDLFRFLIRLVMTVLVIIWYLDIIGIKVTTFLAGLGVVGLAIAFALQNVIADLFAAVAIYLDKPFTIGDTIKVSGESGVVERIGIKSTHIRTPTGNIMIMSNRELSNSKIHNMKRMEMRRVDLTIGVSTETDLDKLERIPDMIKEIVKEHSDAQFKDAYFTSFGDFTFNFQIRYYIKTNDYATYMKTQQGVNLAILRKFDEEDIILPYPTSKILLDQN